MPPNVPTSDRGTATLGMMVAETLRRKTKTTSTTSTTEMSRLIWTSLKAARMEVVRSSATASWMEGGMEARRVGRRSYTRSTVSIMLAPGCRNKTSTTARLPSASPPVRTSSTELTTVATSPRRIGRASCGKSVDLGGRRIIKKKKKKKNKLIQYLKKNKINILLIINTY